MARRGHDDVDVRSELSSVMPAHVRVAAERNSTVAAYRDRFRTSVHPLVSAVNNTLTQSQGANAATHQAAVEHSRTLEEEENYRTQLRQLESFPGAAGAAVLATVKLRKAVSAPTVAGATRPLPAARGGASVATRIAAARAETETRRAATPGAGLHPRGGGGLNAIPTTEDNDRQQLDPDAALAQLNDRFALAFRPMSVASMRPQSEGTKTDVPAGGVGRRLYSPAAEQDALLKTITMEGSIARRQSRAYIRSVTEILRHDDSLMSAFASRCGSGMERSNRSIEERNKVEAFKLTAEYARPLTEQRSREHNRHCEEVYEAKEQALMADYVRFESGLAAVRGEQFSPIRLWLRTLAVVNSFFMFGNAIEIHRQAQTDAFVKSVYHDVVASGAAQSVARVKSPAARPVNASLGFNNPATMLDVIVGVHRQKLHVVDQRREMQRAAHAKNPEGLQRLIQVLKQHSFGYWVKRSLLRRKKAAIAILRVYLQSARDRARARIAIKSFLGHARLIITRWRDAFARERLRIVSVSRQFDHYMAERIKFDKVTCADADRELKRREKAILKACLAKRQTEAQAAAALSPLRQNRAAMERAARTGASLTSEQSTPAPPMTPLQVARLVAAPFLVPHPYGRLGPDPQSSRIAALATLNALGFEKMLWRIPARTKEFVVRFLIARERIAHSVQISAWRADALEAEAKHAALVSVASVASGTTLANVTEQLNKFVFPRMPRRQVFLRPNEMRFWVHLAVMLYAQERRLQHDNHVPEKYADVAAMAAVYNVRNATAVLKRCVTQLGDKLGGLRPGYFDDLPYAIDVAVPAVPESLLPPTASASDKK